MFSGCGGLAFGLCEAGIIPSRLIERNAFAVATLQHNRERGVTHVSKWQIEERDVRHVDWSTYAGRIAIVAGGPPCQPFSQAGRHQGERDPRDMWPEAIRAVREIRPLGFLFENVRGLMRKTFEEYFASIRADLRNADIGGYDVVHGMVNAADYGAAQQRHRVIVAGLRATDGAKLVLPSPTHSRRRLLWDQWISGDYWREHGIDAPAESVIARVDKGLVVSLRKSSVAPEGQRWRTVRDALRGLGPPDGSDNHVFQAGARSYPGHTGSSLDSPAKALKAGIHGVPGGENMLRREDGEVRYFTIREMARLQGLPDDFLFPGTWTESTRQLGNAVPVELSAAFGRWMVRHLRAEMPRD